MEVIGHEPFSLSTADTQTLFQNVPTGTKAAFLHFSGGDFVYLLRIINVSSDVPKASPLYGHIAPASIGSTVGMWFPFNEVSLRHVVGIASTANVAGFVTYLK